MPTPKPSLYRAADTESAAAAVEALSHKLTTQAERVEEAWTYYDTFDWRLWGARLALRGALPRVQARHPRLVLENLEGAALRRLEEPAELDFVWSLPRGGFRRVLEPILEMRRLLPVATVRRSGRGLRILDDETKTVARIALEERRLSHRRQHERLPPVLRLTPLRGYEKVVTRLRRELERSPHLEPCVGGELAAMLSLLGHEPGIYSSKIAVSLSPELRTDEAMRTLFRHLLDVLRANEEGVRDDLDSEFLHDFRVAGRRTRSALTQIRKVFPQRQVERFRNGFAWLGRLTGPTRDLDVYRLKMDGYRAGLPADLRPHLEPLQRHLEKEQRRAHAQMTRALASQRYRQLISAWESFLDRPSSSSRLANAHRPILDVASRRIARVYRRVVDEGERIDDASPAQDLHRLRIEAKKLRYLMELFRSLYPRQIADPIRALKQLQNNLGDHQDYAVQRASLRAYAEDLRQAPADTQMALGYLLERLERGLQRERSRFEECFRSFSSPDNRARCRELFAVRS